MTDHERELHIESCGRLMQQAYNRGDHADARRWLELQNEAVRGRSPERVAEMELCYFCSEGERARLRGAERASTNA